MSETPRTDAELPDVLVVADGQAGFIKGKTVSADFARTLERENAALLAELSRSNPRGAREWSWPPIRVEVTHAP